MGHFFCFVGANFGEYLFHCNSQNIHRVFRNVSGYVRLCSETYFTVKGRLNRAFFSSAHFSFFPWGATFTAFFGAIFQIYYSGAKTFELIDRIEYLIEKRKHRIPFVYLFEEKIEFFFDLGSKSSAAKLLYVETNKFVEKWSGFVYIIATKTILPCLMLPYMGVSYFFYYHSDLGRNAFFLPLVVWYVASFFKENFP